MDAFFEQKTAELSRAQSRYTTLNRDYHKACRASDMSGAEKDFVDVMFTGNLLFSVFDTIFKLETELGEAQEELEAERFDDEEKEEATSADTFNIYSYLGNVTLDRSVLFVYGGAIVVIGFILLCARIGW